jgi:hypothetical protein
MRIVKTAHTITVGIGACTRILGERGDQEGPQVAG